MLTERCEAQMAEYEDLKNGSGEEMTKMKSEIEGLLNGK